MTRLARRLLIPALPALFPRFSAVTAVLIAGASSVNLAAADLEGHTQDHGVVAQASGPGSRDALFGDDLPPAKPPKPSKPASRENLFGEDIERPKGTESPKGAATRESALKDGGTTTAWRGFVQSEFAYTYSDPEHWSKLRGRFELGRQGRLSDSVKYKVTGQVSYDAVFDVERNFYPTAVEHDQRREFSFRETYLDISAGSWEFRLGRQHVIWGEVPGLFFADVVSARDLREFLLPEFDVLRIPQWAVRAEYFPGNAHLELLWIPYPTIDNIGKPGGDYYPFVLPPLPPGVTSIIEGEKKPTRSLENTNYGLRASTLIDGWDLSAFGYRSTDIDANFYRRDAPGPTVVFRPSHDRITQFGGTLAKDMGNFVMKAEAVYNRGKGFSVLRFPDPTGVARLNYVDYLLGADITLGGDTRLNAYAFQRYFTKYDDDIVYDRTESGITALLSHKFSNSLEAQALFITSLNRSEWAFRPKIVWGFARNWRLNVGADILHGPPLGFFGRFDQRDRIYTDLRYSF